MPIGSSMSVAMDANNHLVTVKVWFVAQGGATSEQVDVLIDWSPQVLAMVPQPPPNPTPAASHSSAATGVVLWSNQTIDQQTHPPATPKEFILKLACQMRASTSVEATIGIVGVRNPQVYTAAVLCP